ncbi:MAG: DUF2845 domain-containing protein [Legionellaceae bacterium]|nr:DUF2845 domain-containing protein [Legionellaceae bacterium]
MKKSCLLSLVLLGLYTKVFAIQDMYCPANHAYIQIGMSQQDVLSACGNPLRKETSNRPATERVAVTQLFYNMAGSPTAFFGIYNIPVGTASGANIEVDVVNQKVRSIRLNGSGTNAVSVCSGGAFTVGDPVSKVFNACGDPSVRNETFVEQYVPDAAKPEIWSYQFDPYSQKITNLTFVDGKLQSISP